MREPDDDLSGVEFTIESVRGYPTVFTDTRPMEVKND